MDIQQCLINLDKLFEYKKLDEVEPYLIRCIQEAMAINRADAALTFLNELVGFYRGCSRYEDAITIAAHALDWLLRLGASNTKAHATTLINYATALRAGGRIDESIEVYQQALDILKQLENEQSSYELASLYNNLSIAYQAANDQVKALECLVKAMEYIDKPSLEQAISLVNMSVCYYALGKKEEGLEASKEAVTLFEELHETNDAHYGAALASLADGYAYQGDYQKAAIINDEAIHYHMLGFGMNDDYYQMLEKQGSYLEASPSIDIRMEDNQTRKPVKGLDISQAYYYYCGKPVFEKKFPEIYSFLAFGLVGMGSECLGLDDEISRDHDFGPGFCIFVPGSLYASYGEALEESYQGLPETFLGMKRNETKEGKNRVGVIIIEDFFKGMTGYSHGPQSNDDWLGIEECWLLCASNGMIFSDPVKEFTIIYQHIKDYYPQPVYDKKLAAALVKMAQSGQYQYPRCMIRGDIYSAKMYLYEFIQSTMQLLYLMNHQYMPYTKWQFKMAESFDKGQDILALVKELMEMPMTDLSTYKNAAMVNPEDPCAACIESIASKVVEWLNNEGLTDSHDQYLEVHAYIVQSRIEDQELRNRHIMEA